MSFLKTLLKKSTFLSLFSVLITLCLMLFCITSYPMFHRLDFFFWQSYPDFYCFGLVSINMTFWKARRLIFLTMINIVYNSTATDPERLKENLDHISSAFTIFFNISFTKNLTRIFVFRFLPQYRLVWNVFQIQEFIQKLYFLIFLIITEYLNMNKS